MLLLKDDFNLDTFQQEMVVSMTVVGAFVGSIMGGWIGSGYVPRPSSPIYGSNHRLSM